MARIKDGINKGVGHGIKKPKPKPEKKTQVKKEGSKRVKQGPPTPYLPSSRSPLKKTSPNSGVNDGESVAGTKDSKFFTSKSRAPATVHIGCNIKLTAKYGDMSLKQRGSGFVKKNIGRMVENELDKYLQQAGKFASSDTVQSLPSVQLNPRPAPTRVSNKPSPTRKALTRPLQITPSKKGRKIDVSAGRNNTEKVDPDLNTKPSTTGNTDNGCEDKLPHIEMLLSDWDYSSQEDGVNDSNKSVPVRRSPRKATLSGTPSRNKTKNSNNTDSPKTEKSNNTGSPVRCSSQNPDSGTPFRKRFRETFKDSESPRKRRMIGMKDDCSPASSPNRRSPRRLNVETPCKRVVRKSGDNSPTRSPDGVKNKCSTRTKRSPRKLSYYETPCKEQARKSGDPTPSRSPRRGKSCPSPRQTPQSSAATNPSDFNGNTEEPEGNKDEMAIESEKQDENENIMAGNTEKTARNTKKTDGTTGKKINGNGEQKEATKSVKLFPIFDPKKRLSGQSSSTLPSKTSSRFYSKSEDASQMMIDAGQKRFGAEQCRECGVVYEVGSMEDDTSHKKYHDRFLTSLKFAGWKKENLVRPLDINGGRVIMVSRDDHEYCWRKVDMIREFVDEELGFSENKSLIRDNTRVFLKVANHRIVGMLIAEGISSAYRIIPQKQESHNSLACCSENSTKAWGGVSRIWVLKTHREQGIGSTLVDCMRENMIPNYILNVNQIAFSDPTPQGMLFAERYTKRPDFLVYRRNL